MSPSPRLSTPRIPPLPESDWSDEVRELLAPVPRLGGRVLNIFATLAHHPKLAKRWLVFGNHILAKQTLPPRERELVILRIGFLCRSEYEWGQHVLIARQAGVSDEEIERLTAPPGSDFEGFRAGEAALLRATDELRDDAMISDATWKELGAHFDRQQCMDLVFTVGQYNLVSMALNSFGVQRDEGVPGFPG